MSGFYVPTHESGLYLIRLCTDGDTPILIDGISAVAALESPLAVCDVNVLLDTRHKSVG